ncbi:MAG: O-methyltransferase [Steroidobacteraceae bacterium]
MDIVDPRFDAYMAARLSRFDEPVLLEMEAEASARDFPIVGRNVGITLEVLARSIGARRVFEMGSGFGYSGYWHSRAVGSAGELHLTDGDPENERKAQDYLIRAGLWDPVTYHVGDAVESFGSIEGQFDIVFCDIDKRQYPDAWRAARDRVRVGGLYVCDNVLGYGSGNVIEGGGAVDAVREHNAMIAEDERYLSTIVPTREGVMAAIRIG